MANNNSFGNRKGRIPAGMRLLGSTALSFSLFAFCAVSAAAQTTTGQGQTVASGLNNPRGLAWGPDGALYVALAGQGGLTGQVVKIEAGKPKVVIDNMASDAEGFDGAEGVAAVSFIGNDLYLLEEGAGPGHKHPEQATGIYKAGPSAKATLVADVGQWVAENLSSIHDPRGDLYTMAAGKDGFWVVAANPDAVLKVSTSGKISLVVDFVKATGGHVVPTGLAVDKSGNLFVGTLSVFPYTDGTAQVFKVTPQGQVSEYWSGLTAVVSLAFGPDGKLYALEMSTGNTEENYLNADSGKVVRMKNTKTAEDVQTGINFPIAMVFDPKGDLFVSGPAIDGGNGAGWVKKFSPK